MITLYQFLPPRKGPDPSPFCAKVDTFLKLTKLPHEVKPGNPIKAPKGKLPMIKDGDRVICDSDDIIRYLSETYKVDLDKNLTDEQKALSFMVRKTLEEYFYFIVLHKRWIDDRGWKIIQPIFFGTVPLPLRGFVSGMVRGKVRKYAHGQGIGRHTLDEIDRRGAEVLQNLAPLIPKQGFFFGSGPTLVDCVLFPFLHNALHHPVDDELKRTSKRFPHLHAYDDMMVKRLYG